MVQRSLFRPDVQEMVTVSRPTNDARPQTDEAEPPPPVHLAETRTVRTALQAAETGHPGLSTGSSW